MIDEEPTDYERYTERCSDGNCILRDREKPEGTRTNGGCRHLKERGPQLNAQLRAMAAEIVRLRRMVQP